MKKTILAITMALALISCGSKETTEVKQGAELKREWISDKDPIKGGTLKIGVVSDSQIKGIFDPQLSSDATDSEFLLKFNTSLFVTNADFQYIPGGMADLDFDLDNNIVTYKLRDGLKWSDGEPLTVDDIIFSYKIIGNKDYTGIRYSNDYRRIIGMEEYHAGKTKEISGLEKVSDTVLKVHFKDLSSNLITLGGGLITAVSPYHYLKDIPIKDLESSDKVRLHPLSNGPWKVKQIVPGESAEFVPNEYYWDEKTKPELDGLIMKIIPSATVLSSMKSGEFDTYTSVPGVIYEQVQKLDNIVLLQDPSISYYYFGFNLGHFDEKTGKNVVDKDRKTADIRLRKAMTYAVDIETINKKFYKGLRPRANGIVPKAFTAYYDPNLGIKEYDPEKAKQLLDEAGFKDVDGDGIREDQNGKPLKLHYAQANGGEIAEPLALAFLQYWKQVGLDVELTNGRLIDGANYFEKIQTNSDDVDVFFGGFSVGTSLSVDNAYTSTGRFNYSRMSDPENDKLIDELNNKDFIKNPEKRVEAFKKWHKYYLDNVLGFSPIMFTININPINKRVKKADTYVGFTEDRYKTELVAPQPFQAK